MTPTPDAIGSDGSEAALSRAALGDDPLAIFRPEPQKVDKGSGDRAAFSEDAIPRQAPSVPLATPSVIEGKPRTAGVVNRIKNVLRALDIARDVEKTIDNRLAALRGLGQEVQHRVDTVEQLGRRVVDTIDDLEGRVGDCEARAHIAEQTIARLDEVSSRALPVLQERTKEAEEQICELEQRTKSAATELKHVTDARAWLEQGIVQLQNQLRRLTETAEGEVKKLTTAADEETMRLGAVGQEAERYYQREATHRASTVLAGLETRIAEIGRTYQKLDVAERRVEQLERRAAAAAGEVRQATLAKDELQREIAKCHQQIERLTTAAQGEAEKLNELRGHAEYHAADRPSSRRAHDPLNTLQLRRRGPNISLRFSPAHLIFDGVALALSAAIVFLVGSVWRINPAENQRPEKPSSRRVLASRALTLPPTLAVAPPMRLTADSGHDRPEATRAAPAVPAAPVPQVVVSESPEATSGTPTAAVREQSGSMGGRTPQFVGTLLIESDPPGAAAFVNQESVGDTPVLLKDLRAGTYVVRLEYDGYQRWSTAATVSAIREGRVKAKLERERDR